jgi:amino acid adenylation domain-containing protein
MTANISLLPDPSIPLSTTHNELLYQAFVEQAKCHPHATACVSAHGTCSYAELEMISRHIALHLSGKKIRTGDPVVIIAERSPALVYAILGASRAGAAFAIADSAYPSARIQAMMEQLSPKLIMHCGTAQLPDNLPTSSQIVHVPDETSAAADAFSGVDHSGHIDDNDPGDTAYIVFTSGSTGKPKGIMTSHAPVPHFIKWHVSTHGFSAHDRFSMLSGLGHDPLLRDIFTPLSTCATLCIPNQSMIFDPPLLLEWMRANAITTCHLTPALGEVMAAGAEETGEKLESVRYFFWGGESLNSRIHAQISKLAPNAAHVNFYGATETPQAMAHFAIPADFIGNAFPIGNGIADTQLLLVGKDGKIPPPGQPGEIWIRSPYLSQGYFNDPIETERKFVTNPFSNPENDRCYRTGDLGRYLPDGSVVFLGRIDHQIKIRGFRVEPGEIASTMERFEGVSRAFATATLKKGSDEEKMIVAYFTTTPRSGVDHAKLLGHLSSELPSYMVPARLIELERFPLLPNGKIDINNLPDADQEKRIDQHYAAPSTDREKELCRIWQEILGIEHVGVDDSFTSLGGDSLSTLKALMKMKSLGIPQENLRGIFQGMTIRELAAGKRCVRNVADCTVANQSDEQRTTLLINIVRGLLLMSVIANHWSEGLFNKFLNPAAVESILHATAPFFNIATPGFAFVFGINIGYVFYEKSRKNFGQTTKMMVTGAWILSAGILLDVLLRLAGYGWHHTIDTHIFFTTFFNPLLYYLLAVLTVPLWLKFISLFKHELTACLLLMVLFYGAWKLSLYLLLEHEQKGILQLGRLMLVAKFNYFNMSFGAAGGVLTGIWLKKHYRRLSSRTLLLAGTASMIAGMAILQLGGDAALRFQDSNDMGLWRWLVYSGAVLLLTGSFSTLLKRYAISPGWVRELYHLVGIIGQCTFPLLVLHGVVIPGKELMTLAGLQETASLLIAVSFFVVISTWLLVKFYDLYYGNTA